MAARIRVLHVDDDPALLDLTADYLEREDERLSVVSETNVADGLERLADEKIDCVVSDYQMPEVDGLEFLAAVREEYPDLPFVLFTGAGSEAVAAEAIEEGVSSYLPKEGGTTQYAVLQNRIVTQVEGHRAARRADRLEEEYRLAAETATDAFWILDPDSEEMRVTGDRQFGYETWAAELDWWRERIHPDDRERVLAEADAALDGDPAALDDYSGDRGRYSLSYRWRRADGSYADCVQQAVVLFEDGEATKVVGSLTDVSERRARERELERYETIVEAAGDPVYTLDAEGRYTFVNDTLLAKTGYDEDDLLGEDVSVMLDEDDVARGERVVTDLLASDRRRAAFEMEARTADGRTIDCETRVALLPSDDGFRGTVGVVRDISERKRRERELRRFRTIMETVPVGVCLLDEEGRVTEANERGAAILGVDRDDLVGAPFERMVERGIVPESTVDEYLERLPALLSTASDRETMEIETEVTPPGADEPRVVSAQFRLLPYDSDFEGTVAVYRDVTAERDRERELERKNDRLAEFANIVSHDLRNPLHVAGLTLELLAEDCDSEHVGTIADAHDRMEAIIEDTLTLARQGDTVAERTRLSVADLAESSWSVVDAPDATLTVETDAAIRGDAGRLKHVFENLFDNAVEHGAGEVRVGTLPDGVYVADDGPGVPPDERESVFDPGHTTTEDGTGFGLAIVEQIVEAHGWEIAVTESDRGGARFEITGVDVEDRDGTPSV